MKTLSQLEKALEEINSKLPAFPKSLKDFLATVAPWLTLLGGIIAAWSVYQIWHWANLFNTDQIRRFNELSNGFNSMYGGNFVSASRWSFWLYVAVVVLIATAIIYFLAFKPLKAFKKDGWNLLFIAVIINFLYGIVTMFTNYYGGVNSFIGQIIGTAVSLYILFQIRDYYIGKAKVTPLENQDDKAKPKKEVK